MKQRVISAIIALIIVIPIIIRGGTLFTLGASLIGIIGFAELLNAKEKEKKLPCIMKVLSVICFLLIVISDLPLFKDTLIESMDKVVCAILLLISPIVFFYESKKYDITDALFLLGGVIMLGVAFNSLINVRLNNINYLWFLLLITIITDTFAYITGRLIGRHKMSPNVSPKKTWEGFIGGSLMGTFVATVFYVTAFDYTGSILMLILLVFILSLIGELGDLVFSAIKRHFGIKDYGNIMPGHGGVLDRLDSILFVILAFSYLKVFL